MPEGGGGGGGGKGLAGGNCTKVGAGGEGGGVCKQVMVWLGKSSSWWAQESEVYFL